MCSDEFARTAETSHSRAQESSAKSGPAPQTSYDFEIRPGYTNRPADSQPAIALPPTASSPFADLSVPPASSAQTAACLARAAPAPPAANTPQNIPASPIPSPPRSQPSSAHREKPRTPA